MHFSLGIAFINSDLRYVMLVAAGTHTGTTATLNTAFGVGKRQRCDAFPLFEFALKATVFFGHLFFGH
jgi:hypothetical protein